MNKTALYLRLSKEDLIKDTKENSDLRVQYSKSIINQENVLREYAQKNGFNVVEVYKDDDYSGLYNDRPGFEQMIEDAVAGKKFNIILSKTQSRFTRNSQHAEYYFNNLFKQYGIRFIGAFDGTDTGRYEMKKSMQIYGLVNEWYSEDLSNNIKCVFKSKQRAGEYLAASACYGYFKDENDRHHLVIDEYAAKVVRYIFKLYIAGESKRSIAKKLTDKNIPTPSIYKKEILKINYYNPNFTGNRNWSYQTVHSVLNNEIYIGSVVANVSQKVSFKSKKKRKNKKEDWIVVKNCHEPIIDSQTWKKAQELQNIRRPCVVSTRDTDALY